MDVKNEESGLILEQEKDKFKRDLDEYKEKFTRIKQFTDISKVTDFSKISNELEKNLATGFATVENFNRRENLFKMKVSEWPELKELSDNFKPFYDLITCTYESKQYL